MAKVKEQEYVFDARKGAPFSKKEAPAIGRRVLQIAGPGGRVTPTELLDDARSPRSPLHKHFEWDDGKAAESHRLWQARTIIGSLVITVKTQQGPAQTRAFHHVITAEGGAYATAGAVFSNADLTKQVLDGAASELRAWLERYKVYRTLSRATPHVERAVAEADAALAKTTTKKAAKKASRKKSAR